MGKVIVIKGADFSGNSIEQFNFDGKVFVNEANRFNELDGYFRSLSAGGEFSPNTVDKQYLWPIEEGQLFVMDAKIESEIGFKFVNQAQTLALTNFIPKAAISGRLVIKAPADGYLDFSKKDEGVEKNMPEGFIADFGDVDMSIFANNYTLRGNLWVTTNGQFADGGSSDYSNFYNVVAGESVTIKANPLHETTISLHGYQITSDVNGNVPYNQDSHHHSIGGSATKTISAGQTETFIMPIDGYLRIYATEGYFPEKVTVSL